MDEKILLSSLDEFEEYLPTIRKGTFTSLSASLTFLATQEQRRDDLTGELEDYVSGIGIVTFVLEAHQARQTVSARCLTFKTVATSAEQEYDFFKNTIVHDFSVLDQKFGISINVLEPPPLRSIAGAKGVMWFFAWDYL